MARDDGQSVGPKTDARIERTKRRVREATLLELAEGGYSAFSVEGVSRRSGVSKSTIYRHWRDRADLVADAMEAMNVQPRPGGPGQAVGSARDGVRRILEHLVDSMGDTTTVGRVLPALIEAATQDVAIAEMSREYAARRRETLRNTIAAGVESGEFRASIDPETATVALAGAFLYRRTLTGQPIGPAEVDVLVDTVLGGTDAEAL